MPRTDLERAYADVLFAHIDRLSDICEDDPYEDVVADLVAAFERVARLDPRLSSNEPYLALRRGLGWLFPGDKAWAALHLGAAARMEMTVDMCFTGADGDAQCVLSCVQDGKTLYRCLPLASLALTEEGPNVFESGKLPPQVLQALATRLGCVSEPSAATPGKSAARPSRPSHSTRAARRPRPLPSPTTVPNP